jgi:hypothetical protein
LLAYTRELKVLAPTVEKNNRFEATLNHRLTNYNDNALSR